MKELYTRLSCMHESIMLLLQFCRSYISIHVIEILMSLKNQFQYFAVLKFQLPVWASWIACTFVYLTCGEIDN